jgi:hypothetical protein
MCRVVLLTLILLTGCASSREKKEVATTTPYVEQNTHEHHGSHGSNGGDSDNIGQDIVEDVESGIISGFLQAIFDSIFHRDDD